MRQEDSPCPFSRDADLFLGGDPSRHLPPRSRWTLSLRRPGPPAPSAPAHPGSWSHCSDGRRVWPGEPALPGGNLLRQGRPAGEHGGNAGGEGREGSEGGEARVTGQAAMSKAPRAAEAIHRARSSPSTSRGTASSTASRGHVLQPGPALLLGHRPEHEGQTVCSVQMELNLKQGTRTVVELGPSPVVDLAPGARATPEFRVDDEPLAATGTRGGWCCAPTASSSTAAAIPTPSPSRTAATAAPSAGSSAPELPGSQGAPRTACRPPPSGGTSAMGLSSGRATHGRSWNRPP